jgi:hypothetical protein
MRVYGVHLVSEGTGISVDDNVQEAQFTFVATGVEWWKPLTDTEAQRNSLLGGQQINLESPGTFGGLNDILS